MLRTVTCNSITLCFRHNVRQLRLRRPKHALSKSRMGYSTTDRKFWEHVVDGGGDALPKAQYWEAPLAADLFQAVVDILHRNR